MQDPSNRDYILKDSQGTEFIVNDYMYNLEQFENQTLESIRGILKFHKNEYKLAPRNQNDIKIKEIICSPACKEWQDCILDNNEAICVLKDGYCETQIDCNENQECDNHQCITPEPENLVYNGDLEIWNTSQEADGWIFEYNNQAHTTSTQESSIVFNGNYSAKVKKASSDENTSNKKNEFLSPAFDIDNTKEYDISMMIFDNDPNVKARIYFKFYDESGHSNGLTNMTNGYTINENGWKEYTYPSSWSIYAGFTNNEINTIKQMRVGIRLYDEDSSDVGYIYLDSVKVTERQ
jgi:hypothetical protein